MSDTTEMEQPTMEPALAQALSINAEVEPTFSPDAISDYTRNDVSTAPALIPPTETALETAGQGITAWYSNKKVTALWSQKNPRNAYAYISGMGWKKINNANDSSFLNMSMILALAEQTSSTVNVRIESDNKIHEVYIW